MSSGASADRITSTRGQSIVEHDHQVDVEVYDGYALYTVRRSFSTKGKRSEELELDIELPQGATASNLAILAQGKWHKAELLEQAEARRKYQRLTGLGVAPVKDPAILYWQGSSSLGLQVFPIQSEKTWVEYQLIVPARFENQRTAFDYPKVAAARKKQAGIQSHAFAPIGFSLKKVAKAAAYELGDIRLDSKPIALKQKRMLKRIRHNQEEPDDTSSTLTLVKSRPFQLTSHFAKVDLASDREAVWADINVGRLSKAPKNAHVVFVFDTSRP